MSTPYTGTATGAPTYVSGQFGKQAITLDGATQYVSLPEPGPYDLALGQSWTLEGWLKTTAPNGDIRYAAGELNRGVAGNAGYDIGHQYGKAAAHVNGTGLVSTTPINDGLWHHVVVTVDSGVTAKLFVDGYYRATAAVTNPHSTVSTDSPAYIGGLSIGATAQYWLGQLQDIAFSTVNQYPTAVSIGVVAFTPPTAPLLNRRAGTGAVYHLAGDVTDSTGLADPPTIGASSLTTAAGTDTITYTAATGNGSAVAGYSLYVGSAPGGESSVAYATNVGAAGGTLTHATAAPGNNALYYIVKAYDASGTPLYSWPSNEVASFGYLSVAPANAAILYSDGTAQRVWDKRNPARYVSASTGAGFRFFYANSATVALKFDTSALTAGGIAANAWPQIGVRFGGHGAWQRFALASTIAVAAPPNAGAYYRVVEVIIMTIPGGVDRWLTPVAGVVFMGVSVDLGATVVAPPPRAKTMMVYGDSISEGQRTISNTGVDSVDNDVTLDYSYALGEALDAQVSLVATQGIGVAATFNAASNQPPYYVSPSTKSFDSLYSGCARDLTGLDLVLFFVGQNDATDTGGGAVQTGLVAMMTAIRAASPTCQFLVCGDLKNIARGGEQGAAVAMGATYLYPPTLPYDPYKEMLDQNHPTGDMHATKILPVVLPAARKALFPTAASRVSAQHRRGR